MAISTNGTVLTRVAGALYNVQMSNATYSEVASLDPSVLVNTLYSRDFGTKTDLEVATTLVANLGLTAVTGLDNWVAAQLTAAGANKGAKVVSMLNDFAQMSTTDATYGAAVSAFNTKVDSALALSQTSGNAGGTFAAAGTPVVVGATFTLTTSVDAVSGGAGDDTISGVLGTSGTFTVGDNIIGGAGTDTLNLIAAVHTANGFVSIDGVENVNVRLIGTAAETVELNAADWSGVAVLSNASSLAGTTLDVSGLADDTKVVLYGNTDINIGYNNTSTGATANGVLVSVGSAGTATTIASASATNTANFDFDEAGAGLITKVNLEVQGSLNLARIDADGSGMTYTITGTGNAALISDDKISTFDASAAQGNIDMTFEAANVDVTAKGGAGNDTFRFGTTIDTADNVDGGAGTDQVTMTIGTLARTLNTTNVEVATVAFTTDGGATLNASGSTVTTFNLAAGVASADLSVSQIADASTVNIISDGTDDITLDTVSAASTLTINLGSATGQISVEAVSISDVASLTLNAAAGSGVSGGTAAVNAGSIVLDSDVKTVAINTSAGETDLVITAISGNAVSSLTINSNGSGSIALTSAFEANTGITSVTINASGSDAADVTIGALVGGSSITADKFTSLTMVGRSGADITVGALDLGNGSTAAASATISLDAGSSSVVGTDALDITTSGDFDLNVNVVASQSATIALGTITLNAGTAASGASFNIGALTAGTGAFVGVEKFVGTQSGAQVTVGAIVGEQDSTIEIFGSGGFVGVMNTAATAAASGMDLGNINATLNASANLLIGAGTGSVAFNSTGGVIGTVSLTIADDATAEIGTIDASGVGAITLTVAGDGAAIFGAVSAVASVGAINVGVAASASATFAAIQANNIDGITVSGAGAVLIGTVSASAVGTIDARQLISGTFSIDLSGVDTDTEIKLAGTTTNTVISGKGNDIFTLAAGTTGNDHIQFNSTAQGTDQIISFGAGAAGGDAIEFFASAIGAQVTATLRNADGVAIATAGAADLSALVTGGATLTLTDTDNVIVIGTALATTAAMESLVKTLVFGSAALAGSGSLVVAWASAGDTNVSLVHFDVGSAQGGTTASLITATLSTDTLAVISGVTPGALVAANFAFV